MRVLGIETSCDETSAAIVEDGSRILSSIVASQVDVHRRFGGVVPEVASRQHLERLWPVVEEALGRAGSTLGEVDAVAVTYGPGLVGALMVGVAFAKALAFGLSRPLVGVNHLVGHIYAVYLGSRPVYPTLALIVSGGHTDLVALRGPGETEVLGRSRDDAAGEALDKLAREIGLGYPGGPELERLAETSDGVSVDLPQVVVPGLDFSFSGLKTAGLARLHGGAPPARLAASFQQAVAQTLCAKLEQAVHATGIRDVAIVGGVSANRTLRLQAGQSAQRLGFRLHLAEMQYCTDNAAMIASAGAYLLQAGHTDGLDLDAVPVIRPFK